VSACLELQDRAFKRSEPGYFVHYFEGDPWYKPDYCRIYVEDGRILSALHIVRRDIRVGRANLVLGGIANVATDPDFRGKGYSSELLQDAARVMDQDQMDISTLYTGIQGFYARLGWRTLPMPRLFGALRSSDLPLESKRYGLRTYNEESDAGALLGIYDSFNAGRAMTVQRTESYWRSFVMHSFRPPGTITLAEEEGVPVAYSITHTEGNVLVFYEVGYLPGHELALSVLMKRAAEEAVHTGAEEAQFEPASDAGVVAVASGIADGLEERSFQATMVRFFNLERTFHRLLPELNARAKASRASGSIAIETEVGGIALRSDGSRVEVTEASDTCERAKLTQPDLARVLFGMGPVVDEGSELTEGAREFLHSMFPPQPFVYWSTDMF
jgi:GNAT superfamily N-acetyltransferase